MSKAFKTERHGYKIADVDAFISESNQAEEASRRRIAELKRELEDKETQLKAFKQKQDLIVKSIMGAVQKAEQIEALIKQKYTAEMEQLSAFHDRWVGYYNKLIETYPLNSELTGLNQFNRKMSDILSSDAQPIAKVSEASAQFEREKDRLKKRYIGFIPVSEETEAVTDDGLFASEEFNPEESIRQMLRREAQEEEKRLAKREKSAQSTPPSKAAAKSAKQATADKSGQKGKSSTAATKAYSPTAPTPPPKLKDTGDTGFSFEEALNPTQALSDILKEIGLELGGSND